VKSTAREDLGEKAKFDFKPKPHWEIGRKLAPRRGARREALGSNFLP